MEPLDQQLHGGIDEVARQVSRLCDEASDLRTANDQYYLRRGTIGITDPKSANYGREPRTHFLLVAPGDDPARMFVVGKLRRQVEEGTAAIGGVPDPLRDPRLRRVQHSARTFDVLLFNPDDPGGTNSCTESGKTQL